MGCSLSCIVPIPIPKPKIKSIRIVRLNGSVEEINYPITVAEVTGNQPKDFLFTQASLLAAAATPLKMEAPLEAGLVYFLLPATLFQSNVSPVELAPIVRKLASIALNTKSQVKCSDQIEPLSRNRGRGSRFCRRFEKGRLIGEVSLICVERRRGLGQPFIPRITDGFHIQLSFGVIFI
ncbi:hypothetical protein SASPL_150432 [Salvia splendens]|uniref:Uncharacterized protein n=1 Tax=Salvia splendens TaxID=180675 RepID=A0A8X8W615_SALSN|nr:hypothetical protein SASPL_150432 [Salvia splendens]